MPLPRNVVKQDHDLEHDYDAVSAELMELRWHWTLDASNAKRVGLREYAREVGRSVQVIRDDAKAWEEKVADDAAAVKGSPNSSKTPNEYREKVHLGTERHHAAEAIAKVTGNTVSTVSRTKREEISSVVGRARERAEKKGTSVTEEIDRAVEWDAKASAASAKNRQERKARHTARYIENEGDLGVVLKRLRKVFNDAEDVGYSAEEIDLLTAALANVRALINLIDLRITGQTDIDWDGELAKLGTDE